MPTRPNTPAEHYRLAEDALERANYCAEVNSRNDEYDWGNHYRQAALVHATLATVDRNTYAMADTTAGREREAAARAGIDMRETGCDCCDGPVCLNEPTGDYK